MKSEARFGKMPVDAARLELNGRESFRELLPLVDPIGRLQVEIIKGENSPSTPQGEKGENAENDPVNTRAFSREQEARHFF